MKKNEKIYSLQKNISHKIGFSEDIILGATIVTLEGDAIALVENYKGIIGYTDKLSIIQGRRNKIYIEGKNLQIEYYTNMDMKIKGIISLVKYV